MKNSICEALYELKIFQDILTDYPNKYFGNLLSKIIDINTIPFYLITKNGVHMSQFDMEEGFETSYFRIESVDRTTGLAVISLLRPLDMEGNITNSRGHVFRLEKTDKTKTIDVSLISAVQPLNIELLKRNIIIEPKW
jgi:hypothetical protein